MKTPNYVYKSAQKYYQIDQQQKQRLFCNSVTTALINPDVKKEEEMYQYDSEDIKQSEEKMIDFDVELSTKDRTFFKLWNNFVRRQLPYLFKIDEQVNSFIIENGKRILSEELENCFIIHLTNLLYYGEIKKHIFLNATDKFNEIKTGEKTIISLIDDESEN